MLSALLLSPGLAGCLITEDLRFEEESDVPPVVLDVADTRTPIGSSFWVDFYSDTSTSTELKIDVLVRDENVEQDLWARWRVTTKTRMTPDFQPLPLPGDGVLKRDLQITVSQGDFREGECHRLELVVSGSFLDPEDPQRGKDPNLFDYTIKADDLGYASWWIWEGTGAGTTEDSKKAALLASCDAIEDLVLSGSTEMQP
ncbi:MAG: hypothetical protein OEZ06_30445 [Myxococcales bacterium]|nr:hypothetical protein [Myxococcales bacterium]